MTAADPTVVAAAVAAECDVSLDLAEWAVAVADPLIEARVRAQIAADIRREADQLRATNVPEHQRCWHCA